MVDVTFFEEGLKAHELRVQKCAGCGRLRHPPRPTCPYCESSDWEITVPTGAWSVYTYTIHHRPPLPGFVLPLIVAIVELDHAVVRFVTNLCEVQPNEVSIGMMVEPVFRSTSDGKLLPQFRPTRQRARQPERV